MYRQGKKRKAILVWCQSECRDHIERAFVVCSHAMHGNPYDGDTLWETLRIVENVTDKRPYSCFVDRGYRGHFAERYDVYIAGQKRGVTLSIKKKLKRRNAIEPIIGHMKQDGHLGLNRLKGKFGDKLNGRPKLP